MKSFRKTINVRGASYAPREEVYMMHTHIRTRTCANTKIQRWRSTNTGHLCPIFALTCAASRARKGGFVEAIEWRSVSPPASCLFTSQKSRYYPELLLFLTRCVASGTAAGRAQGAEIRYRVDAASASASMTKATLAPPKGARTFMWEVRCCCLLCIIFGPLRKNSR